MALLKLALLALKLFTAFWALVTFSVAAAMLAAWTELLGGFYDGASFSSGNAVVAAGVVCFLYMLVSVVFMFLRMHNIVASVMVDTICLGFLWVFVLGAVAALSNDARAFSYCRNTSFCALGKASIGLGWILWLLVSIILITQVVYTYKHHGGSFATWRTPVHSLIDDGPSASGRGINTSGGLGSTTPATFPAASGGVHSSTAPAPVQMVQTHQQPVQAVPVAPVAPAKVETSAV